MVRLRNIHQDIALEDEFDSFTQRKGRFETLAESNVPTSTNKKSTTSIPAVLSQKAGHGMLNDTNRRYSARPIVDTVATCKAVNSLGFNSNALHWITTASGHHQPSSLSLPGRLDSATRRLLGTAYESRISRTNFGVLESITETFDPFGVSVTSISTSIVLVSFGGRSIEPSAVPTTTSPELFGSRM